MLLTSLAVCERTTKQSDQITGSNIPVYSQLTLDLPSRQNGKSADYLGSTWELWIRKVLILVKMYCPQGMSLREKALPSKNDIDQQAWTGSNAKPYLSLGPWSWLYKQMAFYRGLLREDRERMRVKEDWRRQAQGALCIRQTHSSLWFKADTLKGRVSRGRVNQDRVRKDIVLTWGKTKQTLTLPRVHVNSTETWHCSTTLPCKVCGEVKKERGGGLLWCGTWTDWWW